MGYKAETNFVQLLIQEGKGYISPKFISKALVVLQILFLENAYIFDVSKEKGVY